MKETILQMLFEIPEPITAEEFGRRTGKTPGSVRRLIDRRRLPIRTERDLLGNDFSDMRLLIMWNEWLEMIYEATDRLPDYDRLGWKVTWFKRARKLLTDIQVVPIEQESTEKALDRIFPEYKDADEPEVRSTAAG